jgi:CDP-paratose 2-epimerase
MKYLITGGCGFLGSNLASEVLVQGHELCILDNLSRFGSNDNLQWLRSLGDFKFTHIDIRHENEVRKIFKDYKPEVIFHLAGQVAMTTSIDNPIADFEINARGSLNLLESVRDYTPEAIIIYSSTNKVYGDLEWVEYSETNTRYITPDYPQGFDEKLPLSFSSPYGCSKGAADQYMLDYAKMFGLKTVVLRHSSMYGGRQFSTFDQGWVGWFCQQALLTKEKKLDTPFTIAGNGKQVRDVLHADDMKKLYFSIVEKSLEVHGEVFNIGGGIANSLSLLELFAMLDEKLNVELNYCELPSRRADQKVFVASIEKAKNILQWEPKISAEKGISNMLEWLSRN